MIEERRNEKSANKTAALTDQKKVSSEPGVTLITMHGSKGLEYDKVFMINCNEETTPHKKARSKEEMEEERRMFYVGMTRAKKELTLLYITGETGTKKEGGSAKTTLPSRFLTELQESL